MGGAAGRHLWAGSQVPSEAGYPRVRCASWVGVIGHSQVRQVVENRETGGRCNWSLHRDSCQWFSVVVCGGRSTDRIGAGELMEAFLGQGESQKGQLLSLMDTSSKGILSSQVGKEEA